MSHTPGPWKAGHMILMGSDGLRKHDLWGVSSDYTVKGKNDDGVEYDYGYAICDVKPADWRLLPEGDAKLIAAAPDLLAACETILRELDEQNAQEGMALTLSEKAEWLTPGFRAMVAAVKKAKDASNERKVTDGR